MSDHPPLLTAKNLACIRQDRVLFESLNFKLHAGDIVQVAGPNGVGKTSLLRILAGLSFANDGDVYYGQNDNKLNIQQHGDEFHQDLLYIGHLAGVKGELTAQENLQFNLALQGENPSPEVCEKSLTDVDLAGFEDSLAAHLSAGQHRRIALARLWQSSQKIWILDEPFTAIDKSGVLKLEQLFVQHAENGGAIILTTHQDFVSIADKVQTLTLEYRFD